MIRRKRRIGKRPFINLQEKSIIPSEYEECKAFWKFCQVVLKLGMSVIHIPNEGNRDGWFAAALKKIGLTPGALDYVFFISNEKWNGLLIDMKRRDGKSKKKDENQELFIDNAIKNGYYATYAYGCDHAIKIYTDYVNNKL